LAATPGIGIDVLEAWRYGRGSDTVLAVVDSGIIAHPEFEGRILPGYDFVSNVRAANDGDGRDADPSDPGDWVSIEDERGGFFHPDCRQASSSWHGTHVAGIAIAAANNGVGIAGIAPLAKLLPVRVMGKCGGTERDLIDGMRWAAGLTVSGAPKNKNPADVINLSLGGVGSCSGGLQSAVAEITALGVMIVAAVGNETEDASSFTPANCFGTATVGALTVSGTLATYSNFGNFVDLSAPGGDSAPDDNNSLKIKSTVDSGTTTPIGPDYEYYRGTSMAAPHLSGVLLIARGYDPLTPSDALYEVLFSNLAPFTSASGACVSIVGHCGSGALDAGRFLAALEARPAPTITHTLSTKIRVGKSARLNAVSDGAGTFTYKSRTPRICKVGRAGKVTALSRGTCRVRINVAGSRDRTAGKLVVLSTMRR
jgi:serine protease